MRPAPPKDRVKLRPGPPKPSRLSTLSPSNSFSDEGIKLLEKDLQIATKKLIDLKNLSVEDNTSSRNGIGLPNSAPTLTNEEAIKFQLTEKIMVKLTEIDREVLNKTGDTIMSRARRSSRDSLLGSDLSCLPAHMTLVDRLIDFHVLIKRSEASTQSSAKRSSKDNTPRDDQEELSRYKALLREKEQEIAAKVKQLEAKDPELQKLQKQLTTKHEADMTARLKEHTKSLEELKKLNSKSLEDEKKKTKAMKEENGKLSSQLQILQKKLDAATAAPIPPQRSPEDMACIENLEAKCQQLTNAKRAAEEKVEKLQFQHKSLHTFMETVVDALGSEVPAVSVAEIAPIIAGVGVDNDSSQMPEIKRLMKTQFEMILFFKKQLSELTSLSSNYEAKIKLLVKKQKEELNQERVACESVLKGLEDQLFRKKDEVSKLQMQMKEQKMQLAAVIDKNTITEQYVEDSSLIKKLQKLLAEANEQITVLTEEQKVLTSQVAEFRHAFLDADEKCRDALFLNRVLTEEAARAKEANDDLRKKMSDLTQTYLS